MQPYARYTHSNFYTLPEKGEEETNLTNATRSLTDYSMKICIGELSLEEHLTNLALTGKKIVILDCGAGSGKVIDALLSGPYKESIKKCVGISLHYFKNVATLFEKHQSKIEWILGPAEKILPDLVEKFDIIFDVYGAHFYSAERPLIIEQYHRVLTMGGKASVHLENDTRNIILKGKKRCYLEDSYEESAPDTFATFTMNHTLSQVFVITKCTEEFPGEKYVISSVKKCGSSIGKTALSHHKLKKGNAWRPIGVYFKPTQGAMPGIKKALEKGIPAAEVTYDNIDFTS